MHTQCQRSSTLIDYTGHINWVEILHKLRKNQQKLSFLFLIHKLFKSLRYDLAFFFLPDGLFHDLTPYDIQAFIATRITRNRDNVHTWPLCLPRFMCNRHSLRAYKCLPSLAVDPSPFAQYSFLCGKEVTPAKSKSTL